MNEYHQYEKCMDKFKNIEIKLEKIENLISYKINELEKVIKGNGKKGAIDRIEELEKKEARLTGIIIATTFIANIFIRFLFK